MIERLIKNEITLKRVRRFLAVRRAVWSLVLIVIMLVGSLTAEVWINSRPMVMSFDGGIYFPVLKDIHPSVFHQDGFVTDYRKLDIKGHGWAIWPLIRWNPFETNVNVE